MTESAPPDRPGQTCPTECRRHAARGPLLALAGWLAAALATLAVAAVPFDPGEALCGVWGCFPPLPPMVAMHLFWCVVLAAAVHFVGRCRPPLHRPFGIVLVVAALAGAAVTLGGDLRQWLAALPPELHHYWPRRVGYVLATSTDRPVVEALVAGVICLIISRRSVPRPVLPEVPQ